MKVYVAAVVVVVVDCLVGLANGGESRTLTIGSRKVKVDAEFEVYPMHPIFPPLQDATVYYVKAKTNMPAAVPFQRLSKDDQEWVLEQSKQNLASDDHSRSVDVGTRAPCQVTMITDIDRGPNGGHAAQQFFGGMVVFQEALYVFLRPSGQLSKYDGSRLSNVEKPTWIVAGGPLGVCEDQLYFSGTVALVEPPLAAPAQLHRRHYMMNGTTQLFKYDGEAFTMLTQIPRTDSTPGSFLSSGSLSLGKRIYILGNRKLWNFDGKKLSVATKANLNSRELVSVFEDSILFTADDGKHGIELWSMPSSNRPSMVADIWPGPKSSSPATGPESYGRYGRSNSSGIYESRLFFSASSPGYGAELWSTDGNSASLVANLSDAGSAGPSGFVVYKNAFWFHVFGGKSVGKCEPIHCDRPQNPDPEQSGQGTLRQLWKYDGDVASLVRGSPPGVRGPMFVLKGDLYFHTHDYGGAAIWRYDNECFAVVSEFVSSSPLNGAVVFEGELYFWADDGVHGYQLWKLSPDKRQLRVPYRTWTDVTDTFTVEARFGGIIDGKVTLLTRDGRKVSLELSKLSEADQTFLKEKTGK